MATQAFLVSLAPMEPVEPRATQGFLVRTALLVSLGSADLESAVTPAIQVQDNQGSPDFQAQPAAAGFPVSQGRPAIVASRAFRATRELRFPRPA